MAEEKHARTRRDCIVEQIENLSSIFDGTGQCDLFYDYAVTLGSEIPWMLASGMLLVSHQNLIAGLHVDAIGDIAVGFCRIAQHRDLVALATNEFGERVAELVPGCVSPDGVVFGIRLVHFFGSVVSVEDGAQYGRGTGPNGAIVQIDLICRNDELLPHRGPECILIFIEE